MWKKFNKLLALITFSLFLCIPAWAENPWIRIDLNEPFTDSSGVPRQPSCSGGPIPTGNPIIPIAPADTQFAFFLRKANPRKLLIALDGGGACWDANTCIGTALAGDPIYQLTVNETPETLAQAGGIADLDNPHNPFANYTQVFIPYCTGDTHLGSKDTTYDFVFNGMPLPWTIHHRGYDNLLSVLRELSAYYQDIGFAPAKTVVLGGSAGGYGGLLALPAVKALLPHRTRTYLLADSANGVINDDFYQRAIGGLTVSGGVWGVEHNVPDFLMGAFASGPDAFAVSVYTTLAWRYPRTHIGQYTRAWDSVQIFYYNVMKHLNYPEFWSDETYLMPTAIEWSLKARTYMNLSAMAPNYRFYIGAGTDHTIVADNSFYTEHSAENIYFSDWVKDMVSRRNIWWFPPGNDWRNVSCAPFCLSP